MNKLALLLLVISVGCGYEHEYVPGPQGPKGDPAPAPEQDLDWTGNYIIGGQRITLVENEDGFINVTGYVYAKNSNNTDGEFYLTTTLLRKMNGKITLKG